MTAQAEPAPLHNRVRGRPRTVNKPPIRDEVRDPPRLEKAVAHGRTRKRKSIVDQFYVDPSLIPPGWTYQWCRQTVYGEIQTSHLVGLMENGWTPVPADRHSGLFMPPGTSGDIVRDGLILMERPKELTDEARAEDKANADNLVQAQKEQLGLAMPSGFDGNHRGVRPQVNTSYERGVPQGRQPLAVD